MTTLHAALDAAPGGHVPPLVATRLCDEGGAFDLPRFAELTYQEYTYCSQPQKIGAWLCETLGICGDDHG